MELIHDLNILNNEEQDFVVFDLETTGLNNRKDRIVEIGAIRYSRGKIIGSMNTLINPEMPIPAIVSSIHGILDSDVADKPIIEEVLPQFLSFIENSVLVAHNASFDVGFIKKALGRAMLETPDMRVLDTIKLSKKAWPGRTSYSQKNLADFLSINVQNAHRAEDDCRVCLEILKKGLKKIKQVEQLSNLTVYTDGGCTGNPGPGGWAAVLLHEGNEVRLSGGDPSTTNNKMELTAVIKALMHINENSGLRDNAVDIYTDSQYVKNGLTQWIHNWMRNGWKTAAKKPVKNQEYWIALKSEADKLQLNWHWVKGHSGNEYNELCDSLVEAERMKFK